MKKERGITLISVIIYVIALLVVVGLISTLTGYFYKNVNVSTENSELTTQFTKFNSYFTSEVNEKNITVLDAKTSDETPKTSYIAFSNGVTYTFNEEYKAIYRNNIKICTNVDRCLFSYDFIENKYVVYVDLKIGNIERTGNNILTFTINN